MVAPTVSTETLSIPLDGLSEAHVKLGFGGGVMTLGVAEPDILLSGTFDEGVINRSTQAGRVELEPVNPGRKLLDGCRTHWDVKLTSEIPVDLSIESGANQSTLDLTPLRIRRLELHTGASDTTMKLPAQGRTDVRVECGFAQVAIEVPAGVAANVKGGVWLGKTEVDQARFPKTADGWRSPDFETAEDRVEIAISGGFGTVIVR